MRMIFAALKTESKDASLRASVRVNREHITVTAEEWLRKGYRMYGIWGSSLLYCWPASAWDEMKGLSETDITISVPIELGEQVIGKTVLVGGTKDPVMQSLLYAQMNLVSQYLTMKTNFEQAAQELVAQAQLKAEIDVVANVQQHLLPESLPHVPGVDIFAYSRPAQQVGGDFYDFFFAQDRIVFVVGDISGKGLPAALFMVMARIVLRTAARMLSTCDPKDILLCANENLYDDFTYTGQLATVFVGCYDPIRRELTYVNAAHSPVIYYPKGGRARFLAADMIPLGVVSTTTCPSHTIPFQPGDLLIVGSDGLNECLNVDGERFGDERLLLAVRAVAHLPAGQIGKELFSTIGLFAEGASQSDDQTLVVVKGRIGGEDDT